MFMRLIHVCFYMFFLIAAGSAIANDAPAKTSAGPGMRRFIFSFRTVSRRYLGQAGSVSRHQN